MNADPCGFAFCEQHIDDLVRTLTAKQLAELFLVICDLVFSDELDEILRRIASECGFREVRITGDEVLGTSVDVSEIASAAAGDNDLAAHLRIVLDHENTTAALPRLDRTEKTGRSAADNDRVKFHLSGEISLTQDVCMMAHMAGKDERKGTDRHVRIIRDAA